MISIALTIVVNLITIAVVTGFQNEIRKKVVGFNAPLFVMKAGNNNSFEADPIRINQSRLLEIEKMDGVKSVCPVMYKPALVRSDKFLDESAIDSNKSNYKQDVTGVVLKGIDQSYPMEFLKEHLITGQLPTFDSNTEHIVLSKKICNDLHFKVGDDIAIFFVKKRSLMKRFKIEGIFETGIEKIDNQMIFAPLTRSKNSVISELKMKMPPTMFLVLKFKYRIGMSSMFSRKK